jgi:hypothetical protein
MKTETTTISLPMNPWSKVAMVKKMPTNACPNMPTIMMATKAWPGMHFQIAKQVSC